MRRQKNNLFQILLTVDQLDPDLHSMMPFVPHALAFFKSTLINFIIDGGKITNTSPIILQFSNFYSMLMYFNTEDNNSIHDDYIINTFTFLWANIV